MSVGRLLHEFRPFFRLLEQPLTRGTPTFYGFPNRSLLSDPFFTSPALDLTEEGNKYIVEAELPGVKKENINITVGDGGHSITIQGKTVGRRSGESSESATGTSSSQSEGADASSGTPTQLTTERLYSGGSSFTRTVWFPRSVDSSQISAKLAEGVLTLEAPKMEDRESIKINVE